MKKVHPKLEGRRTQAIAAGILYYYVTTNHIARTNEEISRKVGVNPVTTGKLYREVKRIMDKRQ
jgi:transcription initiation factor TFIIIB Brf1 subunit/transcription initiation factor TFIIB